MIVYLAVHGKNLLLIDREQRLSSTLGVNDAESFVSEDGISATIDTAPVRTTMAYLLAHAQSLRPERSLLVRLLADVEY